MRPRPLKPSTVHRYCEQLRSWTHDPRRSRKLRRQTARWNQLCASLDSLQQTELAMQAYAASQGEAGTGEHFLALYGLLQAMVLQQDAVCHLDEALGGTGNIAADHQLQAIRKIRNVSVGHPTKVDRRDVMSHHRIARPKLGKGFELVSEFDDGRRRFTYVSIAELMRQQRLAMGRRLRKIVQNLDSQVLAQPIKLKTKQELISGRAAIAKPVSKPVQQKPQFVSKPVSAKPAAPVVPVARQKPAVPIARQGKPSPPHHHRRRGHKHWLPKPAIKAIKERRLRQRAA